MPFDSLCMSTLPDEKYEEEEPNKSGGKIVYECDYDKNPTSLYEGIENKAWVPVMTFLETGEWERGVFFFRVTDPLPPARQAKTWVTRFEGEGQVRWSQLPLHAAIIFGAPMAVVRALINLFPQAVRCTDDQHMLPLHIAIRYGADDTLIHCLLSEFPESIFTKDIRGRLPTEIEGPRTDRNKIIDEVVGVMTKTLSKRNGETMHAKVSEVRDDLVLQKNLNAELEQSKVELEHKLQKTQTDLIVATTQIDELKATIKTLRKTQTASVSGSKTLEVNSSASRRTKEKRDINETKREEPNGPSPETGRSRDGGKDSRKSGRKSADLKQRTDSKPKEEGMDEKRPSRMYLKTHSARE
eukprot:Nitzschia sp. Nitz4//scaffold143_size57137//44022//45086//NITZ4_006520-RA/size57137-processed-gene-0.53-mRNA-1//-1//CDS//3329536464//5360//frame0